MVINHLLTGMILQAARELVVGCLLSFQINKHGWCKTALMVLRGVDARFVAFCGDKWNKFRIVNFHFFSILRCESMV